MLTFHSQDISRPHLPPDVLPLACTLRMTVKTDAWQRWRERHTTAKANGHRRRMDGEDNGEDVILICRLFFIRRLLHCLFHPSSSPSSSPSIHLCPMFTFAVVSFIPTYFHSHERKFHRWNFRSLELLLPVTLIPGSKSDMEVWSKYVLKTKSEVISLNKSQGQSMVKVHT